MRLTLRTLLAYLDDILDPADKEELGKKIESSEFAGDLILRTRDTMRRLRLSAPQVVGTGMGLDPNTVAEYLDNALPPDQVGDFERICLESDMHLAEVAATHHVLTMVLGSPADVDPGSRARMYSIPHQVAERRRLRTEGAHPTGAAVAGAAPLANAPAARTEPPRYQRAEVPEYLRTSGWSRYGWLLGLAALVLVGAAVLFGSGISEWFGTQRQVARTDNEAVDRASGTVGDEQGAEVDGVDRLAPTQLDAEQGAAQESGMQTGGVEGLDGQADDGPMIGDTVRDSQVTAAPGRELALGPIDQSATGQRSGEQVATDQMPFDAGGADPAFAAEGSIDTGANAQDFESDVSAPGDATMAATDSGPALGTAGEGTGALGSPPIPHTPGVTSAPVAEVTGVAGAPAEPFDPYAVSGDLSTVPGAGGEVATAPGESGQMGNLAGETALPPDPFAPAATEATSPVGGEIATSDVGADQGSPFVPLGSGEPADAEAADQGGVAPESSIAPPVVAESPTSQTDAGTEMATATEDTPPAAPVGILTDVPTDGEMRVADARGAATGKIEVAAGDIDASGEELSGVDGEGAEPPAPDLGTYLGGKTVLLRWDDSNGAWFRAAPRSAVMAGDRLLALPEFRPKLTFASGIHMDLSGGSRVGIDRANVEEAPGLAAARADVPQIDLEYGRMVLLNTAEGANSVRLVLGPTTSDVELDRQATLAVEVERQFVPGNDPRKVESPVVVRLYAPNGGVVVRSAAGEQVIEEPAEWSIVEGEPTELTASPTLPEWIDHEPLVHRSEQLYGAPVIDETITTNRPAGDQLLELYVGGERRRKEVKSLAARSSIHVGLFVPFIEALRDPQQRPNWDNHIATLRSAMSIDPSAAEAVWQALVEQRGEGAARDLYEMLRGYSPEHIGSTTEEVAAGPVGKLIGHLESDNLDYRVLAVQNLADLTGKRLMRNPAASASERAQNVRQWRRRMDAGELVPRG